MKEVTLPELVDGMKTAVISYWYVEEGDPVEEGQPLVEVTVDNESYDVISPVDGILNEVFFEEGDEVEVGETIATIEDEPEEELDFGLDEDEDFDY